MANGSPTPFRPVLATIGSELGTQRYCGSDSPVVAVNRRQEFGEEGKDRQAYQTAEVLKSLRDRCREACGLPEAEGLLTEREMGAIFLLCYISHNGEGTPWENCFERRTRDAENYMNGAGLPYYVMRSHHLQAARFERLSNKSKDLYRVEAT